MAVVWVVHVALAVYVDAGLGVVCGGIVGGIEEAEASARFADWCMSNIIGGQRLGASGEM